MNRLESVISNLKGEKSPDTIEKSDSRLGKAISKAKGRLSKSFEIDPHEDILEKGMHDAMFHHALHAKAADRACYHADSPKGSSASKHADKCRGFAVKHMGEFLQKALDQAKKNKHASSMKYALTKAIDFYDSCAYDCQEELEDAAKHYAKGGAYKSYKG